MSEGRALFAFTITTTTRALTAHVTGEIDLTCARTVCSELLQACAELPPPHLVVLDLTDVSFFGAAAVHAIRQFAAATAGRGVRTHLVADPDGIVARVVTLAGLDDVLPTFTTLAQAT